MNSFAVIGVGDPNLLKIVTVIGARPQFIKAAAVSREVSKRKDICEVIVHTGQHFDANMSDIFFEEMQIPIPQYNFEINSLEHGAMTGRMLEEIEKVLLFEKPDFVLVYGDTNSTLAGALAARKLKIKVIHVEAGLRSFNMQMPEEINRIVTDRISDILCCPTENAVHNLEREGFSNFPVTVTKVGDVMFDAAKFYSNFSADKSNIIALQGLENKDFVLCTFHRAENTDDPERLKSIIKALNEISKDLPILLPLHPRTRKIIDTSGLKLDFNPLNPVGYFDMLELLKHASTVMTDSGGLQKEAYFFKKQCLTMRDETEWVELVDRGYNALTGADYYKIMAQFSICRNNSPLMDEGLYGNGDASVKIVDAILAGF
jgi:UDP-GlcNAc3NAcA epimerase